MKKYALNLENYAELVLKKGLNMQVGEELVITAPVETFDFVRSVTRCAYEMGVKKVTVFYEDDEISLSKYLYEHDEVLVDIPLWFREARKYIVDTNACLLGIISDNPHVFESVDPKKIVDYRRAVTKACPEYRRSLDTNNTRWCLVAYPETHWAKEVFPKQENSMELLGKKIGETLWLNSDYIAKWDEHTANLKRRSEYLNKLNVKTFHYKNSLGTDFYIDMPQDYIFTGASEVCPLNGIEFVANMPTQEVFSSPDYRTARGKLVASLPLVRNGVIIKDFYFVFKDGVITEFSAKENLDVLTQMLATDEGMKRLGEIALVGYNSPINNTGILFYETLFDENASCHFALGKAFPSCIKNGVNMGKEDLLKLGLNDSVSHVDFMVGTSDLSIIATTNDGREVEIFKDGDWCI